MARHIEISEEGIRLSLDANDRIWLFATDMQIPLTAISDVRVVDRDIAESELGDNVRYYLGSYRRGERAIGEFRAKGTCVDGAGHARARRQFWHVLDADRVVAVDLHGSRFDRLVLETPDPDDEADRIRSLSELDTPVRIGAV